MSSTEAPPRAGAPATGYGYDIDRVDPRAPGRLGADPAPLRRPARWVRWLVLASAIASALILLGMLIYLLIKVFIPMGIGTSLVALTAALVPVGIVVAAVWWIDRYTPQPLGSLGYAFAWGAIGSIVTTLLFGPYFTSAITPEDAHPVVQQFLGAVIQAPVVEESFKSLGLVLLLVFGRRYIAGPIDGVVYAALIAGGFAFTENILYFANSFHEAQASGQLAGFWETFFMRGLLSPFAHVSFTALAGLGLGIAAERRSLMLYFGLGIGGLALGMVLHALWNGSTFFIPMDPENPMAGFLRYYLIVQVPIFLLLSALVIVLRLREKRILRRQLSAYGRAGWFSPEEVEMLVSMRRRGKAERWARRHGAVARLGMRHLIRTAIALGLERHSVLFARATPRTRARERHLLEAITADRRLIGSLSGPVVRS